MAARGTSKRAMSEQLGVSIRTVGNHINHVYGKLGISTREELAALLSLSSQLLSPPGLTTPRTIRRIVATRLQAGCGERLSPGLWSWHSRRTETTMSKTRSLVASLVVALAFGFVGAACGGDDGGPLQAQAASGDAAAPAVTSAQDTAADDEASNTTGADAEQDGRRRHVRERRWLQRRRRTTARRRSSPRARGRAPSTSRCLVMSTSPRTCLVEAVTQGEFSLLTFAADDGSGASQIAFTAGSETEAAIFVSSNGFTGGGEIGKECSLSTSTNEEKKVEGSFSCKGAKGVKAASLDDLVVDIQGTFTMTRP